MRSAYILCQSNERIDAVNPIRLRCGASSSQGKGPGTKHVGKAEKNRRDVLSDSRMDQKSTECENVSQTRGVRRTMALQQPSILQGNSCLGA
jgi:hypothetical protein